MSETRTTVALTPSLRAAEIRFAGMSKGAKRLAADAADVDSDAPDADAPDADELAECAEFDVIWSTGATIARSSWTIGDYEEQLSMDPSSVDMTRLAVGVPVLTDHLPVTDCIVGATIPGTESVKDGVGTVRIKLSRREGLEGFVQDVQDGIIRNISFGYFVQEATMTERDGKVPLMLVTRFQPFEISLVAVPADSGATVQTRSAYTVGHAAEIVRVRADTINPIERNIHMTTESNTSLDLEGATRAAVVAERTRSAEIRAVAVKAGVPDSADALIESGATVEMARGVILDALVSKQSKAPTLPATAISGRMDETETRAAAMETALCHKGGDRTEKLEGYAQEYRGMSLVEIARSFLMARGVAGARSMDKSAIADAVFTRAYQASTDFPILAGNAVTRTLRKAYTAAPRTFTAFTVENTLPDFKAVARVAVSGMPQLQLVAEGASIPQGTVSEAAERYSLGTYATTLKFTRQVLINDDLGGLMRAARATGSAAARTESDLVWGILNSNPLMSDGNALFSVAHNNIGTAGMVNVADVAELERLLISQVGPNGDHLGLSLKTLAAGNANNLLIRQITGNFVAQTVGGINPYSGVGAVIESRVAGTHWYGFADPEQIDIIELAYLDGQEGVQTFVAPETADFMGTAIRVSLDVGAKAIDWRGVVMNVGI